MLNNKRILYERLGIRFIGMAVQNGTIVNKLKIPSSINKKLSKIELAAIYKSSIMYERFHLLCLVFFYRMHALRPFAKTVPSKFFDFIKQYSV